MNEEIIYSIKLDLIATNQALKEYQENLAKTAASQATLKDTTKQSTDEAKRQEDAAKKTKQAIDAEEGSIRALRESNKKLTAERNNTTLATEEGRKKVADLNKQLDENNEKIKENVDAYTKQKIGIGSYTESIKAAIPFYNESQKAFTVMTTGVGNFTKALVATGIGLFVAALGSLIAYFRGSEEGQNRLNAIMTVAKTIMEKLMDVAEKVGETIYNIATNPKQAFLDLVQLIENQVINRFKAVAVIAQGIVNLDFKQVANGFLQMGTGVENVIGKVQNLAKDIGDTFTLAIQQGTRLASLAAQIDKEERAMVVERARVQLEVAKIRQAAVTQEADVKRATIKEAIALEEQLAAKEEALAVTRLKEAQLKLKANGDDKEALDAVAQAEAAVYLARSQRFEATLRFQKEIERLDDEEAARKMKQAEDVAKWEQDILDKMEKDAQERAKKKEKEDIAKAKKKEADDKLQASKELKVEELKSKGITSLIDQATGKRIDSQKLYTTIFKKGALGEALSNTKAAAIAAFKALAGIPIVGPFLGTAAAAAATAFGIEQYTGIAAIPFARGGRAVSGTRIGPRHGIPITRSNGDNLLATIKTNEVILNEEQQAKVGGAPVFRAAGVPGFAGGGSTSLVDQSEIRMAANIAQQNNLVAAIDQSIRNLRPILVLQDFEAVQYNKDQTAARAQVI